MKSRFRTSMALAAALAATASASLPSVAASAGDRGGSVEVIIALRTPTSVARSARAYASRLLAAPSASDRNSLLTRAPRATRRYAKRQARRREAALGALKRPAGRAASLQVAAYRAIVQAGGEIRRVSSLGHLVTARLPRRALPLLARREDVEAIEQAAEADALDIDMNSASVGAPTWWSSGYTGGRGSADVPATFAVDQDSVLQSHPAFQGITFENPVGAEPSTSVSATQHGTALLSMAAAQGPAGCSLCRPADADELGVARGVSKVLDPSGSGAETDWAAGVPYYWFDDTTNAWQLQAPASSPAQVINYSRGADVAEDDTLSAQTSDATVNDYGVTMTIAAGNSGPALKTVNDPALAYNVIGVGAFSGGGTTDPNDDSIFTWSSRGPTVSGRKKPDLVAVGDGGLAYSYYKTTGQLWKYDTGTSYAAPQVGGGAILLAGAGIRDPKVVKAILIDSARQGRATPAHPMGTQTGWQPDWGWGELDLDAAFHERYNFARDDVPENGARFFRAATQQPGDRATLVWNRRVADCKPLRQGCYYDTDSGFRVHSLSNLDLTEYDAATGAPRANSNSAVDNVEQVRSPTARNVVYKVSAGHIDGLAAEPFALAATRPLTPLATPRPTATLTLSDNGILRAGAPVTVVAEVANPSPDLTAENAQATLSLPAGVELIDGEQTHSLGTLATHGTPGDSATVSWTVRGTTDGLKQLTATTAATRFGSTFASTASGSFAVDSTPPHVALAAPSGRVEDPRIYATWSGDDDGGAGVATFDVDVAANGGPYVPWRVATTETAATFDAIPGFRYRLRVRATDSLGNTSGYATSPEIAVADPATTTPSPPRPPKPPEPPTDTLPSPELKITRLKRTARGLLVRGTVARGANGKVTATWRARRRGTKKASTYVQLQRFRVALRLPRKSRAAKRATLTVTYAGAHRFADQTRRLTIVRTAR